MRRSTRARARALTIISQQIRVDERRHDAALPSAAVTPAERRSRLRRELDEAFLIAAHENATSEPDGAGGEAAGSRAD